MRREFMGHVSSLRTLKPKKKIKNFFEKKKRFSSLAPTAALGPDF